MNRDRGRLAGRTVIVTRPRRQAAGQVDKLRELGATVLEIPMLEIVPAAENMRALERAASELALFDWLVLTSANAVEHFLPLAGGALPARLRVATVGERTADAVRRYEREPEVIAEDSRGAGLVTALAPYLGRQQRVLLPQAADARPGTAAGLEASGAEVVVVIAYRKRIPQDAAERVAALGGSQEEAYWLLLASPSAVRNFAACAGNAWEGLRRRLHAVCIGPTTARAAEELGVAVAAVAESPSDEGLIAGLCAVSDRNAG